jgi:hypothetical protein
VLEGLLDKQCVDGNWPERLDDPEKEELVQFCHGAPGFVILLRALRNKGLFPEVKGDMIERGRKAVWERGFLMKEPCLCYGVIGNVLALSSEQREHFLAHSTQAIVNDWQRERVFVPSLEPWGLYEGLAGRAWGL